MANEEKELFKFVNDPKYREKVINKIHKDMDREYDRRVKNVEAEKKKLCKARTNEVIRITNSRWESFAGGKLEVNRTEGKIRINGTECLFSSIKGAELNMMSGVRVVTTEQSKSKSKKHASLGGAVAGGLILGPVGAVVGGVGLGKTKTKTNGSTVSNQIPTCTHLGVMVNIDGFTSEITLISSQVDQSSFTFSKAQGEAQTLISQLGDLAHTLVPASFLRPDEEASVRAIDSQIQNKQRELEAAVADRPVYALPQIYRTVEQRAMSDTEYLQYLQATDGQRAAEREANEMAFKQEQAERKVMEKQRRMEEKEIRRHQCQQKKANADYDGTVPKAGKIIYNIAFWIFSSIDALFALVAFTSKGIVSGILFLITALLINPKLDDVVDEMFFKIPKWAIIVIMLVGFFAGVMMFPTA